MDLRADRVTLNRLFGTIGEQFQIPPYQRPYAWGTEQIDDLWDDLAFTLDEGHFLGTIVLNNEEENRPQIIDGQQRLITLLLLLSLIRNHYKILEDTEGVMRAQRFMMADEYAKGDDVYRLKTGLANWQLFRDLVLRNPEAQGRLSWDELNLVPKSLRTRNEALIANGQRLTEKLDAWLAGLERRERLDRIRRLEESLVGKVQLVAIRVGSVADAFLLFETLNDRGLQLSAADLLKNHLLARIAKIDGNESSVREVAQQWDALLDDLGSTVDVTRFLRHYLLIHMSRVRKDDVYDKFKAQVSEAGPRKVIEELRVYGRLYGEFEDPNRVEEQAVSDVLHDLSTLRAVTCYSALLPARRYLSSGDFVEFARLAEVLTYRYSTIVGLDSKELERVYHRAAKLIAESKGNAIWEASQELVNVSPDGDAFKNFFQRQRMGRQYLVRYTLGKIEEHLKPETERVLRRDSKLHIEHIMPRNLNPSWREMIGERIEEHGDYVGRWGNLTLLFQKLNIAASNNTFERKKIEYRSSEVHLTKLLCELDEWSFDRIEERQQWLAEVANEIWSVQPFERFKYQLPADEERLRTELRSKLTRDEWELLRELSIETSPEELLAIGSRVRAQLDFVLSEPTTDKARAAAAREIAAELESVLEKSNRLDAPQRALARGAIEYFVIAGDEHRRHRNPEGLGDDVRVAKAVSAIVKIGL